MASSNYPADTLAKGVALTIEDSNVLHSIINGGVSEEIAVDDGNITSLRKAIIDNFYFKDPIDWEVGGYVTDFNQLVRFTDGLMWLALEARPTNPVLMGNTPSGDSLWTISAMSQSSSVFTLSAEYVSSTVFRVLGDYVSAMRVGQQVTTETSLGSHLTNTIIAAEYDETYTLVTVSDTTVPVDLESVAITYWPYEDIETALEDADNLLDEIEEVALSRSKKSTPQEILQGVFEYTFEGFTAPLCTYDVFSPEGVFQNQTLIENIDYTFDENETITLLASWDSGYIRARSLDPTGTASIPEVTVVDEVLTLNAAVTSTDLAVGDHLVITDRASYAFEVVDASGVTANGYTVVECTGSPDVALVLTHSGCVALEAAGAVEGVDASDIFNLLSSYISVRKITGCNKYTFEQQLSLKSYLAVDFSGANITVVDGAASLFLAVKNTYDFSITGGSYTNSGYTNGSQLTSFFIGEGERVAGVNTYSKNYSISKIRCYGFNWLMECTYSRTWNLTDFFSYGFNGIYLDGKCVESNIANGTLFGSTNSNSSYDNHGYWIKDTQGESMYIEGGKMNNVTVDGFLTCAQVDGGLDVNISDCWLGCNNNPAGWALKFEQGSNNFFLDHHYSNNTYDDGQIEFVSHTTPVTTAFVKFTGGTYQGYKSILIGNFWHDIAFSDFTYHNASFSQNNITAFVYQLNNERVTLDNITFKGSFGRLAQVLNDSSTGSFTNLWCDEYVEEPFYIQSPIRLLNCPQSNPLDRTNSGPVCLAGRIANELVTSGDTLVDVTLPLSEGSVVELTIHGTFTSTGTPTLELTMSNCESLMKGSLFDQKFFQFVGNSFMGEYKTRWRVLNDSGTEVNVRTTYADITPGYHCWYTVEYVG